MPEHQDCLQCGKCCEKWGWDQKGTTDDLELWIGSKREDILRHVGIRFADGTQRSASGITAGDLLRITRIRFWIDDTGKTLHHCPFFHRAGDGKAYCRIHDSKPRICTGFTPWSEIWHDYGLNCPACRDTTP